MDGNSKPGRRYSPEEKTDPLRMVRTLRAELGTDRGTAELVALQLGYGVESVRAWVRQTEINDGLIAGLTSDGSEEIHRLHQPHASDAIMPFLARVVE